MNTEKRNFIHEMMNEAKAYCEKNLNENAVATFSMSERVEKENSDDNVTTTTIVYAGQILETETKQYVSVSFYSRDTVYETCRKAVDYMTRIRAAVEEINKTFEQPKPVEQTPIVSIHKTGDEVDGVRVCVGDEDFVIALKDAENPDDEHNEFEWAEACEKFNLPTVKQAHLMAAYLDEIQAKLVEAGGEKLSDNWYWTKSESNADYALLYDGTYGIVIDDRKYYSYGVRPVLASNA